MKKIFVFTLFILVCCFAYSQDNPGDLLNQQDKLLNDLEVQWNSINLELESLTIYAEELEIDNNTLKQNIKNAQDTITELKVNIDNYKKALMSNKDDTSYLIGLIAEANEELTSIKEYVALLEKSNKRLKNTRITSIALTGTGLGLLLFNNVLDFQNQRVKDILNGVGIGCLATGGLTLSISFAL